MSLLRTDRLSIAMTPARGGVAHVRAGLWRKESRQALLELAAGATGKPAWQCALDSLSEWLAGQKLRRAATTLVLSNRFVRYALVPWSDAAGSPEEERELALACFESRYGDMTGWAVRLDDGRYGAPRIACAVETALLDAAQQTFARHGLSCEAVRPSFVAGWNRFRREFKRALGRSDAVFAVAESDTLVMATRRAGAWHSLRSVVAQGNAESLAGLIEREVLLQGFSAALPAWLAMPGRASSGSGAGAGSPLRIVGTDGEKDVALALAGWAGKP